MKKKLFHTEVLNVFSFVTGKTRKNIKICVSDLILQVNNIVANLIHKLSLGCLMAIKFFYDHSIIF